jgi:hypothetical protein
MKRIFTCLLILLSVKGFTQTVATVADPALSQMEITDLSPALIDPLAIPVAKIVKLDVPIFNLDLVNSLPTGSCKIKIGLGARFALDPGFDIASVNSNEYFDWTAAFIGGQVQLTGDLKAPLPKNYAAVIKVNVVGDTEGPSTVTTNFLISNHNTSVILSDSDPSNNTSFLAYRIVSGTVPVNFSKVSVAKSGCSINVAFTAENEINVKKYEIETSKDGLRFVKVGEEKAASLVQYKYGFSLTDLLNGPVLYVRVKSVDNDGSYQYSETKKINGQCSEGWGISLYPNPVRGNNNVTIGATGGLFNGKHVVSLFDIAGKLLSQNELLLNNVSSFNYPVGKYSTGEYLLKVTNKNSNQSAIVKIQKLN